jgi:hypothetical protein
MSLDRNELIKLRRRVWSVNDAGRDKGSRITQVVVRSKRYEVAGEVPPNLKWWQGKFMGQRVPSAVVRSGAFPGSIPALSPEAASGKITPM